MWKNLDRSASIPLNSHSSSTSSESVSEILMGAIRGSDLAKEQLGTEPKSDVAQNQEPLWQPMLREYAEAVNKCTKSAHEFVRCASLLSEAREAYDKLCTVRGEIQRVMASDEAKLSALMALVQKTADTQMVGESGQSSPERKAVESSKIASISIANGERSKMTKFP
jgi:hypothetical protein